MIADPLGYYARLGVSPDSPPAELKAAFRREARRLHPDAAGTGDAGGFLRLKEAYDVLADPARRAAYHRASAVPAAASAAAEPPPPSRRGVWFGAAAAGLISVIVVGIAIRPAPAPVRRPPLAPRPAPIVKPVVAQPTIALRPAGPADHYVLPGGDAAVWGLGAGGRLDRLGSLPPFATIRVSDEPAPAGLVAVLFEGGVRVGLIDTARLMAGDAADARKERCAYLAGAPPENGEVLAAGRHGDAGLGLANDSAAPAVVTLRDPAGAEAGRVYLAPGGAARLTGLPAGPWTAEVAFGELWSRSCAGFVAGERRARLSDPVAPDATLRIGAAE